MKGKEVRIITLLVLDVLFFLVEAIIGYSVHSLALIADSFHMLNDIISLIIALLAVRVKNSKPADGKYTYGWQRAEILGALMNAVFLLALCFTILIEAIQRFFEVQEISQPKLILVVGCAGLVSNFIGLALFHEHGHSHSHGGGNTDLEQDGEHGHSHGSNGHLIPHSESNTDVSTYMPDNVVRRYSESSPLIRQNKETKKKRSLNLEGVFLHVLGDALGNVGVIITALFIWKTNYSWRYYTDPFISLVITTIIFSSALPLCRKSSKILLQATPPSVNSNEVVKEILKLPTVKSVHDFHVWNLNEDILIASLHLELQEKAGGNSDDQLIDKKAFVEAVSQVREILHDFDIHSATIQPEFSSNVRGVLQKKGSAYGLTTKFNCLYDGVSNCDNVQCLK
ncbi:uncharacterized protein PRCAT00001208001 [Priceomyces carsonii]|uniref:uncharacterized protein n=1 Tax=Priceomyces carsonii TaxID=28549 RepID=UPI002ED7BC1C|nr:unnamed protein product [Priceomyces carsonii]